MFFDRALLSGLCVGDVDIGLARDRSRGIGRKAKIALGIVRIPVIRRISRLFVTASRVKSVRAKLRVGHIVVIHCIGKLTQTRKQMFVERHVSRCDNPGHFVRIVDHQSVYPVVVTGEKDTGVSTRAQLGWSRLD